MRHARQWMAWWAKVGLATWLVHTATGLGWLQSLAAVALVLWGALEAFRALARLLEAFQGPSDNGEGDDGGGEEEEVPPLVIRVKPLQPEPTHPTEPQKPRQEWKN